MRALLALLCTSIVATAVLSRADKPTTGDEAARAAAKQLFASLSDEQKALANKDFGDKERSVEDFPARMRPGLPIAKLTAEQKALVEQALRGVTSEYGAKRCLEVAKQAPEQQRFINFFGNPATDERFAWRVVQHHLTLVYAEFGPKATEFGPVLLGGNPVKDLWADEEKIALEFMAALTEAERKQVAGKGSNGSGAYLGKEGGLKFADLSAAAKPLAVKLLEQRLAVFSAERKKAFEQLITQAGGVDHLRIAFWGDASKGHLDGGVYHWKIGTAGILLDWQTASKNHLHMTVKAKLG
jgi:hypothetical protein